MKATVETPKPRRRVRRFLIVGLCAAVALIVMGFVSAIRPRWHTFTTPALEGTGLALQMEYPDDWKPASPRDYRSGPLPQWPRILKRTPPTGLTKWWHERVLRRNKSEWEQDEIISILIPRSSGKMFQDMDIYERYVRRSVSSPENKSIHRFMHPLGPALDIVEISSGYHHVTIFPEDTLQHHKAIIELTSETSPDHFQQLQPIFDEVVRRVRLVEK